MRLAFAVFSLAVFAAPSMSFAQTPSLEILQHYPVIYDNCRNPTRPAVGRLSLGGKQRMGSYVGLFCQDTRVWFPETGNTWFASPNYGMLTNASGNYLVADTNINTRALFDVFNQTVTPFPPGNNASQFNNSDNIVYWSGTTFNSTTAWMPTSQATHAVDLRPYENVAIYRTRFNGLPAVVVAHTTMLNEVEVLVYPVSSGVLGAPITITYGGPAGRPDVLGSTVVMEEGGGITWWDYGTGTSGQVATSGLCSNYSAPLLGRDETGVRQIPYPADYVVYTGTNCGVDGRTVLYLTDLRDLNAQRVFRIDEVLPSTTPYKAEYDTQDNSVGYISYGGTTVIFTRFLLP